MALEQQSDKARLLLHDAIAMHHSTRLFLPKPIPENVLREAIHLAQLSPSEYNARKWRVYVVTGDALERLKGGLKAAALEGPPATEADLAPCLMASRSALGKLVYGQGWGIPREDTEADARRRCVTTTSSVRPSASSCACTKGCQVSRL